MQWIDREWLEQQIDDYTEKDRLATLSAANQLARITKSHGQDDARLSSCSEKQTTASR